MQDTQSAARSSKAFIDDYVIAARELANQFAETLRQGRSAKLVALHGKLSDALQTPLSGEEFVDTYAQSLIGAAMAIELAGGVFRETGATDWLLRCENELVRAAIFDGFDWLEKNGDPRPLEARSAREIAHCYEQFLKRHNAANRKGRGVYYTPDELVSFVVRGVDEMLRSEFDLADGLADATSWGKMLNRHPTLAMPDTARADEPFVKILDPAAGSGAFLIEVVEVIHRTLTNKWVGQGCDSAEIATRWNEYVPRDLLPRLHGFELMLPAATIAHVSLAVKLLETGFDCCGDFDIQVELSDTLADPAGMSAARTTASFTVIVGNPPYAAVSDNHGVWIDSLLKGSVDGELTSSYYEVDGQPLGERKLWLHDDYVKFIRYAQWRLEKTGCGLLGFVTNHGYLENATFRGMRQQLSAAFPRISVVDLHGNSKNKKRPPNGGRDQNVFGIDQGVAIGLLRRPPSTSALTDVRHAELWGSRLSKLRCLSGASVDELDFKTLSTRSPSYLFVPNNTVVHGEYERGFKLTEIMPVNTTAPVTARDSFVIDIDKAQLLKRLQEFRDLTISDDEIRHRYFTNGRSTKYPPGDTRGWKLRDARQRMANDHDWQSRIRRCQYRPFDCRWIYWADWMVDWPRTEVMQHLRAGDNLALVARRQMPSSQPCTYFWITRDIAIDGLIRSDNRGSESLFPLRCGQLVNMSAAFITAASAQWSLEWRDDATGDTFDSAQHFNADQLLRFIYALFHSPTYRQRFADSLRTDFPRVLLPKTAECFRELSRIGTRLIAAHTSHSDGESPDNLASDRIVRGGFPKWIAGNVFINKSNSICGTSKSVWDYHIGGYQVCRKWLKDRRNCELSADEIAAYRQMVASIELTISLATEIDAAIEQHGGWPRAFV